MEEPVNVVPAPVNLAIRRGLGQPMSKWRLRFGGSDGDLSIDEFLFRVENLALADGIPQASLVLGLHFLLTGSAANFYWVYRRKRPQGTWLEYRQAFLDQFATQETDLEIRKAICDRRQGQREDFGEFSLEVERMVARMRYPMEDDEVIEVLKQNMLAYLQNAIWLTPPTTLHQLKLQCRRMERLRRNQEDLSRDRKGRVNEIGASYGRAQSATPILAGQSLFSAVEPPVINLDDQRDLVEAVGNMRGLGSQSRDYIICWNCEDMGHTYADCAALERRIFCYGCGTKNVIKPQCQFCNRSGNGRTNVPPTGVLRSRNSFPTSGQIAVASTKPPSQS